MEGQICHLVSKLMEIFEVDQPLMANQLSERLISSARRTDETNVRPASISLDEIQSYRGESGIKVLYNEIMLQDGGLRGMDAILHLASRLGSDDGVRKFIKIHNLLRTSQAKKQQQQREQQLAKQSQSYLQQQSRSTQPFRPIPVTRKMDLPPPDPPKPKAQVPVTPSAIALRQTPHQKNSYAQPSYDHQKTLSNNHNSETPKVLRSQTHHHIQHIQQRDNAHNLSASMVAITPAVHRGKRDKSRRNEKGKNDILYQKMRSFLSENQFLSFDFKKIDWTEIPTIPPLSTMSVQEQESALINDLLYVLIGTEGKYVRMQPSRESPNKHTIGVERGGDELVYTSASRIIKICPLYSTVVHYAEDVNFGLVNQALASPIRELVKEYLSLITYLRVKALRDDMTLQSMWLHLQTIFHRMEALKQILDQISHDSCYGGHTLSVLHHRVENLSTDPRTHEFCRKLMQAASEPYFEILERWLYLGIIEDPYGEFFIEDTENRPYGRSLFNNNSNNPRANIIQSNQNVDIDAFWRKRFTRDDSKVPQFLREKSERIFETGKYLSVVRHRGKKIFRPLSHDPLAYSPESRYDEKIDEAYKFASKELLELLFEENKLIDRLYSLKRYFLFSSGDFFVQFMDMADEELSKTKDEISMTRLESLLGLALRTSSCNEDPYKDDVHIKMSDGSLYQVMATMNSNSQNSAEDPSVSDLCHSSGSLFGWESITLSYDVAWPLSMIICKDYCLTLYQIMFRHLFCCKYIERKLENSWRCNRWYKFDNYEGAFALRHKMLHFVHNLLSYITEIIEPSFQILISKFRDGGIESVNDVITLHRAFLSGLVHDSMLTDNELLGHVTRLLLLCMDFSVVLLTQPDELFHQRMSEIDRLFNEQILQLLGVLTKRSRDSIASSKLHNIFYRLDFNNFYTENEMAS